jgi:putative membrane protein
MRRVSILLSVSIVCGLVDGTRGEEPAKLPLDNAFLIKMATCNYAVISISKMAETQGSPDVKTFAGQLVKDHQESYDKLADLLKTRKVGVVSGTESETKTEIKRLGDLKGTDFDKEYLKWVIKEHNGSIPIFENQIKLGKDDDVRAYAKENLDISRKHLQKAEELPKTITSK